MTNHPEAIAWMRERFDRIIEDAKALETATAFAVGRALAVLAATPHGASAARADQEKKAKMMRQAKGGRRRWLR